MAGHRHVLALNARTLKAFSLTAIFAAAFLAATFVSCSNLQGDAPNAAGLVLPSGGTKWVGKQTLNGTVEKQGIFPAEFCSANEIAASSAAMTDGVSKTILPQAPLTLSLKYYITAKVHEGTETVDTGTVESDGSAYSIELPFAAGGTYWDVTIYAQKQIYSSWKTVLTKTETIFVNSNELDPAPFQLEYSTDSTDGTGSIDLTVTCDSSSGVAAANATREGGPVAGITKTPNATTGKMTFSFTGINPGSYKVTIIFYSDTAATNPIYAVVETANVYANLSTSVIVAPNAPYVSGGAFVVTHDCVEEMGSIATGGIYLGGKGVANNKTASDSNTGTAFAPVATLAKAFELANALAAADPSKTYTINVKGDSYAGKTGAETATLNSGAKVILKGMDAASYYTIDASTAGAYSISSSAASLKCENLTFDKLGGITVAAGKMTMNNCQVTNGTASADGTAGGITVASGATFESTKNLTISACGNSSTTSGGAAGGGGIYSSGTVNLTGTTIIACKTTAYGFGGGIYNNGGVVSLNACNLLSNEAGNGGGIYTIGSAGDANAGKVEVSGGSVINLNRAKTAYGGGIYDKEYAPVTITASYIGATSVDGGIATTTSGNYAQMEGGGFYIGSNAKLTVTSDDDDNYSYIYRNYSAGSSGGMRFSGSTLVLHNTEVCCNYSGNNGGGVYISGSGVAAYFSGETYVDDNQAKKGGGVYNLFSTLYLGHEAEDYFWYGDISGNQSTQDGGGVYNDNSSVVHFEGGSISSNTAGGNGSGVYNNGAFKFMGGFGAQVYRNNDFYADVSGSITVDCVDCAFPCAVIKPYSYVETRVYVNGTNDQALKDYYKYFAVAPDGTQNYVMTDSGKIAKKFGTKFKPDTRYDIVFSDGSATNYEYAKNMSYTLTDAQKAAAVAVIFYVGKECSNVSTTTRMLGVGLVQHEENKMQWCASAANAKGLSINDIKCEATGAYNTGYTFDGDVDGSDNFSKMAEYLATHGGDDTGTSGNYPVFDYCSSYSTVSGTHLSGTSYANGWYLPSIKELYKLLWSPVTLINALQFCGGDALTNAFYWSSSQAGDAADKAMCIQELYFTSPSVAWYPNCVSWEKYSTTERTWSVRPIREF